METGRVKFYLHSEHTNVYNSDIHKTSDGGHKNEALGKTNKGIISELIPKPTLKFH